MTDFEKIVDETIEHLIDKMFKEFEEKGIEPRDYKEVYEMLTLLFYCNKSNHEEKLDYLNSAIDLSKGLSIHFSLINLRTILFSMN